VLGAVLPAPQTGAWSAPTIGGVQAQFGIVILTVSLQVADVDQINSNTPGVKPVMPEVADVASVMLAPAGLPAFCVHAPPVTAVAAKVAVVIGVLPTHTGAWSAPAAGFTQAQFGIVILTVSLQVADVAQINSNTPGVKPVMPDVADVASVMLAPAGLPAFCVHAPPVTVVAAKVAVVIGVLPTQTGAWSEPATGFGLTTKITKAVSEQVVAPVLFTTTA
jgi:hypothetical protein